jgi:hypothetical protein
MSAFMVKDKTINYVVNWLRREIDRLPIIAHKLKEVGFDMSQAGWAERLGQEIFSLISRKRLNGGKYPIPLFPVRVLCQ